MRGRTAATLLRLALVEIGEYPLYVTQEDWKDAMVSVASKLSPEDGWALVRAAGLLAAHPDPGFWRKLAESQGRSRAG